jgi:plastocyanin
MTTHLTRGLAALTATVACALALSGCGSSSSTAGGPSQPESSMTTSHSAGAPSKSSEPAGADMIMIQNFAYSGASTVKPGATVSVMNMDTEAHTVTADSGGAFDVTIQPGKTATFTAPTKPGSYPYHCTYHSNMHGTLRVS